MSKRNKWWLLYLRHYSRFNTIEAKIIDKEFDSELDLLVWASKNQIPKGIGWHFVVSPSGLQRLPVELYERIEFLRRQQADEERKAETIIPPPKRPRGRPRKATKLGEVCTT